MKLIEHCLTSFCDALKQTLPSICVKQNLLIKNKLNFATLIVNKKKYLLNKNVHIVGIGKAACELVSGAEEALGNHVVDGIATVPVRSVIPANLKTLFFTAAVNNLPDNKSIENTKKIIEFLKKVNLQKNQIILFLISEVINLCGGSALLSMPIDGLTLNEKLEVIKTLTNNGADIKQLNIVRKALSKVKRGKMAEIGAPSQMISLIMSDIVNDPIDLISSGPTVFDLQQQENAIDVINKLNLTNKINKNVLNILQNENKHEKTQSKIYANNLIICNNRLLLKNLAKNLTSSVDTNAVIVTSTLEGNASHLGIKIANLLIKLANCFKNQTKKNFDEISKYFRKFEQSFKMPLLDKTKKRIVFIFGGETTVCFPIKPINANAKGGRNQEFVLSAFKQLIQLSKNGYVLDNYNIDFGIFSLGTDGEDGPTDATGAFITSVDILHFLSVFGTNSQFLDEYLYSKNSYEFWSNQWRDGKNIIKLGKTGTNLMDVQLLCIEFFN